MVQEVTTKAVSGVSILTCTLAALQRPMLLRLLKLR